MRKHSLCSPRQQSASMRVRFRSWSSAGAHFWRPGIVVYPKRTPKQLTFFLCVSLQRSATYSFLTSHLSACGLPSPGGVRAAKSLDHGRQEQAMVDSMESRDFSRLREAADEFPPPPGTNFSYGTSGFRTTATLLDSTLFRSGVLAALRSLHMGKATGLMVSASHNPVADNGVKLVDPNGDMLLMDWEEYAEMLANCSDAESFVHAVHDVTRREAIHTFSGGKVYIAMDTRPSGPPLLYAAKKGVEAVPGVVAVDKGVLTTPQLHWMVREHNLGFGESETQYFETLSNAFRTLMKLRPSGAQTSKRVLCVDGANGVGAMKLVNLESFLADMEISVRNTGQGGPGILNANVGADYVQKEKVLPQNFDSLEDEGRRCVSVDGDADRLVYFYYGCPKGTGSPCLRLLDGDKIMVLFATFVKEQLVPLSQSAVATNHEPPEGTASGFGTVSMAAVQTAYANGASTKYLENLGIEVALTKTGVKHLHKKATAYDIGIYFEANGHGTILLKDSFVERLKNATKAQNLSDEEEKAIQRLLAVTEMVNQAAGDALSGILMVEIILEYRGWTIQDWDSIYEDYPSRQLKVKVADRSIISTSASETRVTTPIELQEAIDAETAKFKGGRSFVRPSGTEDIVRIYSEAASQAAADTLAMKVRALVYKHAGGVGAPPSLQIL